MVNYGYGFPEFTKDLPTHIFDNVYISGINFCPDLPRWCDENGFTAIISFAADQQHYDVKTSKLPIKIFKIKDRNGENIVSHLKDAKNFYDSFDPNMKVLVHCMWGMSRSATCVIYLLMSKYNIDFTKAFMYVKNKRPVIQPNKGFLIQLKNVFDSRAN